MCYYVHIYTHIYIYIYIDIYLSIYFFLGLLPVLPQADHVAVPLPVVLPALAQAGHARVRQMSVPSPRKPCFAASRQEHGLPRGLTSAPTVKTRARARHGGRTLPASVGACCRAPSYRERANPKCIIRVNYRYQPDCRNMVPAAIYCINPSYSL